MNYFQHPRWKNLIEKGSEKLLQRNKQIIEAWKKLVSKCRELPVCQTSIKQLTVLLLAVFLVTGMIGNMEVFAAEEAAMIMADETITANRVLLDGKEVGYVCDPISARAVMDEVLSDKASLYNMDISTVSSMTFETVSIKPEQLSTKASLEKSFKEYTEVLVKAYSIYADDELIGVVKLEEEAHELLNHVKSQFLEEGSSLEDAYFQEEVKIEPVSVPFAEVKSVDELKEKIKEAQETIEEYTIQENDTLWDISRKYKIDLDELMAMNPERNPKKLRAGQTLRLSYPKMLLNVVTTQVTEYEESIAYETETKNDSSMYTNQSKVIQEGEKGLKKVEVLIKKVNGVEKEREVISEEVIKKPVNKIIATGTKALLACSSRGSGRLAWPTKGRITSRFGRRWGKPHKGIDIANSKGTPIYAADSGTVTFAGRQGGYGRMVKISHGGGLTTLYAHMSSIKVKSGQKVSKGQVIGYMGSTGNSTGPHLHFEVRVNDNPKNPLKYLP